MSDPEPLINFNCACGKPVQTPVSLCGQKLHCPYEGCEAILQAPSAVEAAAAPAPAEAKPKQPRMPPPKGRAGKGDAGVAKKSPRPAPAPAAAAAMPGAPAASPAPGKAASSAPAAPAAGKKKKNALFFGSCSAIAAVVVGVVLNSGKGDKPAPAGGGGPAPAPAPAVQKAAAEAPVPSEPAPPLVDGSRKPRQEIPGDRLAELNARLAGEIEAQKKAELANLAPSFEKHLAAAESGGSDEWIQLAEDYMEGRGTEVDKAKAKLWLEKAAARQVGRAYWKLADLVEPDDRAQAIAYLEKGGDIAVRSTSTHRNDRLDAYARRLAALGAEDKAAALRAQMTAAPKGGEESVAPESVEVKVN